MKVNRDLSVILINALDCNKEKTGKSEQMKSFAFPFSASGVRAIRFEKEIKGLKGDDINIIANDLDPQAVELINENKRLNDCNFFVTCKDANDLIMNSMGFDYIDIDPFGSPNAFLNSAAFRISRGGILAVTATDTAPLAGTYPKTCIRNYWARPLRNELKHELGLRILIRKVQLIAAQFEKAAVPIFSYYKDHYFRIFFRVEKGKTKTDQLLKEHVFLGVDESTGFYRPLKITDTAKNIMRNEQLYGPYFSGKLYDDKLVNLMRTTVKNKSGTYCNETVKLLETIYSESSVSDILLYNIHALAKRYKFGLKKIDTIIDKICKTGYRAARTHFDENSIKTDIPFEELIKILKK